MRLHQVWILATLSLATSGCGGGDSVSMEERQALADYEDAAEQSASALDALGEASATLVTRLDDGSSDAMIDAAIDAQALQIDALERAVGELEDAEALLLQPTYGDGAEPTFRREGLAGAVLYVLGVAAFAVTMRALSDQMIAARMRRDAAAERGDTDAYQAEQREVARIGTSAAEAITTKVIPNPVDTVVGTIPGGSVLLATRDAVNDLTTLTATEACRADADSDECKFGATTVDSGDTFEVPAGTLQVSVTGAGLARTIVDGVVVAAGETVIIEIDPVAHADLPVEGMDDIQHCFGHFGCFDGTSDWLPMECASEGGTPMDGPCP